MPLSRHYVLGRRSKRASARRKLREARHDEDLSPSYNPTETAWDGTDADLYEPRCPAAPDECKCVAERAGQEGG